MSGIWSCSPKKQTNGVCLFSWASRCGANVPWAPSKTTLASFEGWRLAVAVARQVFAVGSVLKRLQHIELSGGKPLVVYHAGYMINGCGVESRPITNQAMPTGRWRTNECGKKLGRSSWRLMDRLRLTVVGLNEETSLILTASRGISVLEAE